MSPNPRFETLKKLLIARGISPLYARRYVRELADHREDVLRELHQQNLAEAEAQRLADERLGPTEMLANAAISKHQSQTLMGRHPRVFFAALPFIMVPIFFSIIIIIIAFALTASRLFDQGIPLRFQPLCMALFSFFKCTIPAAVGVLYYRAARRRALSRPFRITTSTAVILWAAFFSCSMRFQNPTSTHGHVFISLGIYPNVIQALAIAVPILLYAWLTNRFSERPTLAS